MKFKFNNLPKLYRTFFASEQSMKYKTPIVNFHKKPVPSTKKLEYGYLVKYSQ